MGVYIPNMEMPTRCYTCPCADLEFHDCNLIPGTRIEQHKRLDDCPLVPVPPHGRCIDANEFLKRAIGTKCFRGDYALMLEELVGESTTIIPAEEGE